LHIFAFPRKAVLARQAQPEAAPAPSGLKFNDKEIDMSEAIKTP
jgi:hypothetical protein